MFMIYLEQNENKAKEKIQFEEKKFKSLPFFYV